jgi:tetratricopeptide (TPR) repeat protein
MAQTVQLGSRRLGMTHTVRVLVIAAFVAVLPGAADAKWTRLNTANFVFIGDASAGKIREVAEKLEQFREVMTRALPGATSTSPVPTIVVVFATDRSLTPVKPLFRSNTTEVGGYLQTGEDLNYIAINGEYIDIALMTIFHEYAHLLTANTLGPTPAWLSEGLAGFYEMTQVSGGGKKVMIGRASAEQVQLLKGVTLIPIKELLAIDQRSQVYNEGNRRNVFYAQSWALTHYLTLGSQERAPQFRQYLTAVRNGVEPRQAFTESFKDVELLDRELFDYVRKFLFNALVMEFEDKVVAEAERPTTIGDVEGEIHVADLQARVGRADEARDKLKAIVGRKPDAVRAWATLGLIDLRESHVKEALPVLERAAAGGPRDAFVLTSYGRALVAAIEEETASDSRLALMNAARVPLAKAVELDMKSSYAAGLLGYVELALGSDLPRAVTVLEQAARLAPSRESYRLMLAQAFMRQGNFPRATDLLGTLLASGRTAEVRDNARSLLAEIGNARARASRASSAESGTSEPIVGFSTSSDVLPPRRTPATVRLDLRTVQSGESRALGQFTTIECTAGRIVLHVVDNGRVFRLAAKQMSDIDFITYRTDTTASVSCGPLKPAVRALVTYRPTATTTAAGSIDGDAVAIELVPDDYQPEAVVR